jgi:AmmeMemoRadiSam system protein B
VAGSFYPRDAGALAGTVDALLAAAPRPSLSAAPGALVCPHAGYAYSGVVAAHAFRCLESASARTLVLVGPSHVEAFDFSSVFEGEAYRTPLGDVPVDTDLARAIAEQAPSIRFSRRGHVRPESARGEHCLEVLLPFVQRVVPEARVVPIVMGSQHWQAADDLGNAIARVADPARAVVLASSDLSHFHPHDQAVRLDTVFCDTLETLDAAALHRAVAEGRCEACGAGPVVAAVRASARWPGRACRVLSRATSGDVTGDRASVVGYMAAVIVAASAP